MKDSETDTFRDVLLTRIGASDAQDFGPYSGFVADLTVRADNIQFLVGNDSNEKSWCLYTNGKMQRFPEYTFMDGGISADGTHSQFVVCREKREFGMPAPQFSFLLDGQESVWTDRTPQLPQPMVSSHWMNYEGTHFLYLRFSVNPASSNPQLEVIHSAEEAFEPFSNANTLWFSPDGEHWSLIVQNPEDRKFSILLDGKLYGKYDQLIRVEVPVPHPSQWCTYGLRDGKWYRVEIQ